TYSTIGEEELIKRMNRGDEAAFTEIYNRYWERLLAIGYYHTQNTQAAEDVVHEVMMSLWMRRNSLQIQSLNAYLATAVKFAVFKSIAREKKLQRILEEKGEGQAFFDIEQQLDARFLEDYLKGAVEQLPEKSKLVFNYSRHEELSVKAIADQMDLSPKAVEYHITKALKMLRKRFNKIKAFFA
ncbi:MAG TPA: RNA polymerase sigma-70 factor, partial [Flavisolibacter sp.]|nr:RNA polymerase sigma-70 factor [Flavisolibacter sp.]